MEYINKKDIVALTSDSQVSHQLLWNENSSSERVTITRVQVFPGKTNIRHAHESSEQIWIAIRGCGTLLLGDECEKIMNEGDVVRFADGDIHGVFNHTDREFEYISVTSPPLNFRYAYDKK